LYGDSVFETLRTYAGRVFELQAHLARLQASAALVFIDLPVPLARIEREISECIAAAGNPESYVRVMLTRGRGALGLDPSLAVSPSRVVIVDALVPPPASFYENGIAVSLYRAARTTDATAAEGAKVGNYLVSVLAMREARLAGAAEALIVDGHGRVLEGASSNVFMFKGRQLFTPGDQHGILRGITRAKVLDVAAELGIEVVLHAPAAAELAAADEVFITSSIREIVPVVKIDGAPIADGRPGPLSAALRARFKARVADWLAAEPT
jgi:branched-chain amino acid aminotransferase